MIGVNMLLEPSSDGDIPLHQTLIATCPECGVKTSYPDFELGDPLICSGCGKPAPKGSTILRFRIGRSRTISAEELIRPLITVIKDPSGRKVTVKIPTSPSGEVIREIEQELGKGTEPRITTSFERWNDRFRYSYTIENGLSAYQDIDWFRLNQEVDDLTALDETPGWIGGPCYVGWWRLTADPVKPGATAGPFTARSALGPGLLLTVFSAPTAPAKCLNGSMFEVNHRVLYDHGGPLSEVNRFNTLLTIGPAVQPKSLKAIHTHLACWAATFDAPDVAAKRRNLS